MSQLTGKDIVISAFDADTFGVVPAVPDGQLVYKSSFSVTKSQNRIADDTMADTRGELEPMLGNVDVAGSLTQNISGQSIGFYLRHLMGGIVTTGAGPYQHVFSVDNLPAEGAVFQQDLGSKVTGVGRYLHYVGCKIDGATFTFPTEGACTVSYNIKGTDTQLSATTLDATLTDNGHTSFSAFSASIEEGGSAFGLGSDVSLTISNNHDDSAFALGGGGKRVFLDEANVSINGSMTVLFDSVALMNKALNDTESSLKITLSRGDGLGSAGNESIEFLLNQIKYEPVTPPAEGPAGIKLTLNFFAYKKSADLGLIITLKNALATV